MAVLGQITINEISLFEIDSAPDISPGVEAPIGSIAVMTDGSGVFQKTGASDTSWTTIALPFPIPADQISFSTLVAFFTGASNVKDALDLLGTDKANLYGGNNFTGDQSITHPSNNLALAQIRPGYFAGNSGLFIRTPTNSGPFILGYLDSSNNIAAILARATTTNQVISGSLPNDTLLLSADRTVLGNTTNSTYAQVNQYGLGVGFLTSDQSPSALVEMRSTSQGFLMPRLSESQINAISSPQNYLTVFNTTRNCVSHFMSGIWSFRQYAYIAGTASNSTVNFINMLHTFIAALPGGLYRISGFLTYNSAATTTGIGVRLSSTSGGFNSMFIRWSFSSNANGSTTMFWHRVQLSATDNYTSPNSTSTTNNIVEFSGFFSSTPNTVPVLQFRSEVAGSAVTITNGFFIVERMGY